MLKIDPLQFQKLDEFALLARQDYNLGNSSDWFGYFRGGLYGFYGRVFGVGEHFRLLHEWLPPRAHLPEDTEYHLSSAFFNMDSALECLTFALNALGFAANPDGFRNVGSSHELRKISPTDILGRNNLPRPTLPLRGYGEIYPGLQSHFATNDDLLATIFDLHDYSKHREALYTGGKARLDPPHGYVEVLKMEENDPKRVIFSPHETILLKHKPKNPRGGHSSIPREEQLTLETIVPQFFEFLGKSSVLALSDVRTNIALRRQEFPPEYKSFQYSHVPGGVWK